MKCKNGCILTIKSKSFQCLHIICYIIFHPIFAVSDSRLLMNNWIVCLVRVVIFFCKCVCESMNMHVCRDSRSLQRTSNSDDNESFMSKRPEKLEHRRLNSQVHSNRARLGHTFQVTTELSGPSPRNLLSCRFQMLLCSNTADWMNISVSLRSLKSTNDPVREHLQGTSTQTRTGPSPGAPTIRVAMSLYTVTQSQFKATLWSFFPIKTHGIKDQF